MMVATVAGTFGARPGRNPVSVNTEAFTVFQEDTHMRLGRFALVATVGLATIMGCAGFWEESSSLSVVGVNEADAYFAYSPEWSGFETLPSSFWQLDLETGKATRVYEKRVQYDLQLAGNYVVAERPTNNDQSSEVVAKSVASGDESVIFERNVKLGGHYDREFIAAGTNVVGAHGYGFARVRPGPAGGGQDRPGVRQAGRDLCGLRGLGDCDA